MKLLRGELKDYRAVASPCRRGSSAVEQWLTRTSFTVQELALSANYRTDFLGNKTKPRVG
jgi:hypothetical protein